MKTSLVSIVIPAYNEAQNLPLLFRELNRVLVRGKLHTVRFEFIVIDDGSTDDTVVVINKLQRSVSNLRLIVLSRNYGHQAALKAGLAYAEGDAVITMDADLQHPPKLIPSLVRAWTAGAQIVYTVRRDEATISKPKQVSSRVFYGLFRFWTGVALEDGAADFRLLDRVVVDTLAQYQESALFLRAIIATLGFRQHRIEYRASARAHGTSHYTAIKMVRLAMTGIVSFSTRPLYVSGLVGFGLSLLAGIYALYALIMYFFFDAAVLPGWASILVSGLFVGGVQLMMLGIIGVYIGATYLEVKRRPAYVVQAQYPAKRKTTKRAVSAGTHDSFSAPYSDRHHRPISPRPAEGRARKSV